MTLTPRRPTRTAYTEKPRVVELLIAAAVVLLLNLLYYALLIAIAVGVGVLVYKVVN